MTAYNADYYLILKFEAKEEEVALMLSIASLAAACVTLTGVNLIKGDVRLVHGIAISIQSIFFVAMAMVPAISFAIVVYAMRDVVGIVAESTMEAILIESNKEAKVTSISIFQVLWELFTGVGKYIGSSIALVNPDLPFLIAAAFLFVYSVVFVYLSYSKEEKSREFESSNLKIKSRNNLILNFDHKKVSLVTPIAIYKFDTI
ncbi:MAG: hypothetical protein QXM06_02690 [Archaeoglobaceae archaeon]